jgi:hypothetical protein
MLFAILAGTGCAHAPRAYVFNHDAKPADQTIALVAGSLSRQGHQVATIDRQNAEIVTTWEDTRYRFRETDDLEDETDVFLRYRVQLKAANNQISVTAEAQRCVPSRAVVARTQVLSTCVKMNRIFGTQQQAVDRLGQTLAASIGGSG